MYGECSLLKISGSIFIYYGCSKLRFLWCLILEEQCDQSDGYSQPYYCSPCLLNFWSLIINYCMIFVLLFLQNKLSCRLSTTKNRANNAGVLSYSVCWAHTVSLLLTCFFQKAIHPAPPGSALSNTFRSKGPHQGSPVFCPHWDDPKRCSSFTCFPAPPSTSFTSSPTRLLLSGTRHVTASFLQQPPPYN